MGNIKLVVVGPGLIGNQHIKLIRDYRECVLSAIVSPETEENFFIALSCGVKLYPTISACLSAEEVDGVIVSSPNAFHFEQAKSCIEAAIPVLIEKPITSTLDEGRAIVDLVQSSNARVMVGHHRAHSPILAKARSIITSGRLGRLVSVIGSAQFYKPAHYFLDGPWRTEPGGGPILINLIHEIGNLRTLLGEISAVQAIASSSIRHFPVEDTVAINFIFANGALGTFLLSDTAATAKSWEQTSRENPSYPSYQDEDCYTVTGTMGSLSIPTMRLKCYATGTDSSWWTPFQEEVLSVDRRDPLQCQLEHFIDVIKNNAEPLVSAADGFRNLLVTEAIRESAARKSIVYIEE